MSEVRQIPSRAMKDSIVRILFTLSISLILSGLQADSKVDQMIADEDEDSIVEVGQDAPPDSGAKEDILDDDLAIFTPETRARILRERQLAILNTDVFGDFRDGDEESAEESDSENVDRRVTEIGLITLREYTVIPWESREAERLLAEGLVLYTEEARERVLKEKYLGILDRNFLNRWEIPFMAGTSAADRAHLYEEEARFARFEDLTKRFLTSLKENRNEAYKDLKKLYIQDRHDRIEDQRNILGLQESEGDR